jgi:hypothetical protein
MTSIDIAPLDYSRSFICHEASFNSVRFWVESRTRLIDGDDHIDFLQCASCKSEDTFAPENLFYEDNYDFLPIFGRDDLVVFRRYSRLTERYREVANVEKYWGTPIYRVDEAGVFDVLEGWDEIYGAAMEGLPIVSQTYIRDETTDLGAVIECPVKTLNLGPGNKIYQVDTGPVAFPDLTRRHDPPIDSLSLAFIAFNSPTSADFIIEQPTKVEGKGGEACWIYHYSNPFSLDATNRLISIGR